MKMFRHGARAFRFAPAMLMLTLSVAGCDTFEPPADPGQGASGDAVLLSVTGTPVSFAVMQDGMARLARQVAQALGDAETRRRVYGALQASPIREHKVRLRALLNDENVGLRRSIVERAGVEESRVSSALDSLVDLEFYMPVKEHVVEWRGGENLIVASYPDDDGSIPVGFDLNGGEVMLSAVDPPSVPTLVITPVESDFRLPDPGDPVIAASYADSAWFMKEAWIPDDHEGWGLGDPEFEVHVYQEQPTAIVEDISCSGNDASGPYDWDMNNSTWSGNVMLGTQAIIDTTVALQFQMWEDDYGPCTASGGRPPRTSSSIRDALDAWTSAAVNIVAASQGGNPFQILYFSYRAAESYYDFVTEGVKDEFVGVMLGPDGGCWPPREDGAARFVMRESSGGSIKGDAMVDVTYGDRDPLCDLSVDIEGPNPVYNCDYLDPNPYPAEYEAVVFGGDGSAISYQWKEDGGTEGTSSTHQMQDYSPGSRRIEVLVNRGSEEATDVLYVTIQEEDPEESEHCIA